MMSEDHINTLRLSSFDLGGLRATLRRQIDKTEHHRRVCGERYTAEETKQIEIYLGQLRRCLIECDKALPQFDHQPD